MKRTSGSKNIRNGLVSDTLINSVILPVLVPLSRSCDESTIDNGLCFSCRATRTGRKLSVYSISVIIPVGQVRNKYQEERKVRARSAPRDQG